MIENKRTWNFIDKSKWPTRGEWDDEPDKVLWIDDETGLDCMIHRGPSGAWCGYVGLPDDHKFHGTDYEYVMVYGEDGEEYPDVHGGLTFSKSCREEQENGRGICHSGKVANKNVWWLGFDCAHSGDFCPSYEKDYSGWNLYRDQDYAIRQTNNLAAQLMAKPS